jgi:chemotaxis regulatin CheY-phosphate phosphatase CheZ
VVEWNNRRRRMEMTKLTTRLTVEDALANVMMHQDYKKVVAEYERLLKIMGNVEEQVVALVLLATMEAKNEC